MPMGKSKEVYDQQVYDGAYYKYDPKNKIAWNEDIDQYVYKSNKHENFE